MKPLLLMLVPLFCLQEASGMAQTPIPAPNPDQAAVVEGNNAFAADLYRQLSAQSGNLFFSPESISTAFAMAYAGASGSTAAEMAAAMHYTLPSGRLHPAMGALLAELNAEHAGYQLRVADALWAEKDYKFLDSFLAVTRQDYAAGFRPVDFKGEPDAARLLINRWVEEKTEDKIKDLLPRGTVKSDTRLVLTNAIYFKGDWATQFSKTLTHDEDFHTSATGIVKTPLMHLQSKLPYYDGGTFKAVDIPYKSGELSMVVLLPNDVIGLPALEQSLTAANLQKWLHDSWRTNKVFLALPKFKMTGEFELSGALSALGMRQAFQKGVADFSAMTGKRDLWISTAIHKAHIDVNEEGTEAAAATGIGMRSMAMAYEAPPIFFRADHPFIFFIRDNRSGAILFVGRVADPAK
jgi:serpin B